MAATATTMPVRRRTRVRAVPGTAVLFGPVMVAMVSSWECVVRVAGHRLRPGAEGPPKNGLNPIRDAPRPPASHRNPYASGIAETTTWWTPEQLGAVDAAIGSARAGRPTVLAIDGEPGQGKSSLLAETIRRAEGFTVLTAEGTPAAPTRPLDVLRRW